MKVSITYLYTISRYGYPPNIEDDFKALADIEKMGFHYLEMEGLGVKHTEAVSQRRHDLKKCLDDHGIHVHNFCGVDADLVSMDDAVRQAAYERFKLTAELATFLGAETLHLASYAPPVIYEGKQPYQLDEDYSFGDSFKVRIPEDFNWPHVWNVLVDSCRHTAVIAAECNKIIIMEPRVGEIICSVDSMLRLIDAVDMPNFKANFDTGHFSAQRENIPLALEKLKGKYANIHVADNNPINSDHVPIDDGIIEWQQFFSVLKRHKYDGYLGLDLGDRPSLTEDLKRSLTNLRQHAAESGVELDA